MKKTLEQLIVRGIFTIDIEARNVYFKNRNIVKVEIVQNEKEVI